MKLKQYILIITLIISTIKPVWCQGIPESQREDLETLAMVKLNNFTQYVTIIGDKDYDMDMRNIFINKAVKLFKSGSKMEVSSLNSTTIQSFTIQKYLTRLRDLKYDQVKIDFAGEALYLNMSTFEQIPGTDRFVGTAVITQRFRGSYDGIEMQNKGYEDVTQKVVALYIEKKVMPGIGISWAVFLGDVTVKETKI